MCIAMPPERSADPPTRGSLRSRSHRILSGTVAVQQTPLSSETRTHFLSRDFCLYVTMSRASISLLHFCLLSRSNGYNNQGLIVTPPDLGTAIDVEHIEVVIFKYLRCCLYLCLCWLGLYSGCIFNVNDLLG